MLCFAFQQAEQHCKEDLRCITNSHRKRIQCPSKKGVEETMKVRYLAQRRRAGELEKLLARTVKEGGTHRSKGMWNLSLQCLCWTLKVYDLKHPSNWCYHFIPMATTLEALQLPNWKNRTQGTCCLSLLSKQQPLPYLAITSLLHFCYCIKNTTAASAPPNVTITPKEQKGP